MGLPFSAGVGVDSDDQSAFEFRPREILGFRFGFKRFGQAGISSL
jgi:hypothetical protein